jgi:arylsulfatase A
MKSIILFLAGTIAIGSAAADQPNIVFILADDMAWHGTGTQMEAGFKRSAGKTRRTPHIDRLAKTGMVFSRAFSAAGMCAPSRCSIQTGMSAARTKFSGNGNFGTTSREVTYDGRRNQGRLMLEPSPIGSIDPNAVTMAECLIRLGYATTHLGKWHVYGGGPGQHGYDVHDGETSNAEGNSKDPADPKNIFSMTRKAIGFIEGQVAAKKPFFVQVSHYAEHNAVQYLEQTYEACLRDKNIKNITPESQRKRVAQRSAMVEDMDRGIGTLLEKLDQLGVRENTYVIFTSDNGHYRDSGEEKLLRGDKWWLWEGGIRVPMIVSGPGVGPESNCDANVVGYDFLPTFVELAGGHPEQLKDVDGVSLKPLFGGNLPARFTKRSLHLHYPHHRNTALHSVVVRGDHKLFRFWERPGSMYLYNLDHDIRESANVAKDYPAIAKELDREMNRHFTAVNASLPKPNPNADPAYKPYDPDAPETTSHAEAPTAKKSDDPVTKKPDDKAAKKLERQKRREARKKVRDR